MDEICTRHGNNAVIGQCQACGKGICRECQEEFGYFCSQECLEISKSAVNPEEKEAAQRKAEAGMRFVRLLGLTFKIAGVILVLALGYFIWSFFFAPYGSLAWRWEGKVSETEFVSLAPDAARLMVFTPDGATVLDTVKGVPLASSTGAGFKGLTQFVATSQDGAILHGKNKVGLIGQDAELRWLLEFEGRAIASIAADETACVVYLHKELQRKTPQTKDDLKTPEDFFSIVAINTKDGSILWDMVTPVDKNILSLAVSKGRFAALCTSTENNEFTEHLKVFDIAKGKVSWQVKLEAGAQEAPFFAGDAIVFGNGKTLNAVAADGSQKLWSINRGAFHGFHSDKPLITDGRLVVSTLNGLTCVAIAERKILWEKPTGFLIGELYATGDKILALGYNAAGKPLPKEDKKPVSLDDLKDSELTPAGLMAKIPQASLKDEDKPFLAALDAKTGEILWKRPFPNGHLLCGSGRIVRTFDSARDLMISIIGGSGKGDFSLTQISLSNGKNIADGSDPIGLCQPMMICGRYLVGTVYDRATAPSMLSMTKSKGPDYTGIAAFRLK